MEDIYRTKSKRIKAANGIDLLFTVYCTHMVDCTLSVQYSTVQYCRQREPDLSLTLFDTHLNISTPAPISWHTNTLSKIVIIWGSF
jgi:hypothetical protein